MVDDIVKSVRLILQERITSPLSGAIIFSWFVWNWRLVYFLISPGEHLAFDVRMKVIETNYLNLEHNLYYPLLSAVFLVGIYPFFTTITLAAWLWFKRWQNRIRQDIQKSQVVTLEQWMSLREEIDHKEEKFNRTLSSKDAEVATLKNSLDATNREVLARNAKIDELQTKITQQSSLEDIAVRTAQEKQKLGKQLADALEENKKSRAEIVRLTNLMKVVPVTGGVALLSAGEKTDNLEYYLRDAYPAYREFRGLGLSPGQNDAALRFLKSLSSRYSRLNVTADDERQAGSILQGLGFIETKKNVKKGVMARLTPKGKEVMAVNKRIRRIFG